LFANRYAQPQRHIGARLLDQAALVTWCSACAATHKMGRRRARDWSQAFTLWLPSKVAMLNIGPPRLRAEWLYRPFSNFLRRDGKRSESPIGILHRNRSQPLNCALEACASSHTKARSRRLTSDWPPIRRACLNHCNAGCQAARHQRTDDRYLAQALRWPAGARCQAPAAARGGEWAAEEAGGGGRSRRTGVRAHSVYVAKHNTNSLTSQLS
jgi:hypothetical protein